MPHFIDCILVLLDFDKPVEISAVLENPEGDLDELGFVYAYIRFKNGIFVTISQLPDEISKTPHFYWYAAGTEGSIWQDNVYNKYDLLYKNARHTGKAESFIPEFLETKLKGEKEMKDDFTVSFYDNVWQVLREGKEQIVKPEQVLLQIEIIEKIIESARLKRAIKI
jgi:predicted dehydrogenase